MKMGSKRMISMYLGVALLAVGSAFAASVDTIRATVPFDFMIGKQAFTAGEYSIRQGGAVPGTGADVLVLRPADDRSSYVFLANSAARVTKPQPQTKLIFHRYGNRYFLREIWVQGELSGNRLPPTAAEREAGMSSMTSRNGAPDEVIVLATR